MSNMSGLPMPTTFKDVLTLTNNYQGLGNTLTAVQDAAGNSSPMQISLNAVNFIRTNGNAFALDGLRLIASVHSLNSLGAGGIAGFVVPQYQGQSPYDVRDTDSIVALVDDFTVDGTFSVVLPDPNLQDNGRMVTVKDETGSLTGARTIVVSVAGGALIDGMPTYTLSAPYKAVTFYANLEKWYTLSTN